MEKPTDKLQLLKEKFEKVKMHGDLAEAASKAKVSAANCTSGLARNTWGDLTKSERKALLSLSELLCNREKEEKQLEAELQK